MDEDMVRMRVLARDYLQWFVFRASQAGLRLRLQAGAPVGLFRLAEAVGEGGAEHRLACVRETLLNLAEAPSLAFARDSLKVCPRRIFGRVVAVLWGQARGLGMGAEGRD